MGQKIWIVDCVGLDTFNVSACVVEAVLPGKQLCQGVVNPKQFIVPVERGCISEGYFEMVNGLLRLPLGAIYIAKNTVTLADLKLFAFLWDETNRTGCGLFCGVELSV